MESLFTFLESGISVIHFDLYRRSPYQVYCGRVNPHYKLKGSPLANPVPLEHERDRDKVCDAYADYLVAQIQAGNQEIIAEMSRLASIWREHQKLELVCWCSPKRCHCETIKRILEIDYK